MTNRFIKIDRYKAYYDKFIERHQNIHVSEDSLHVIISWLPQRLLKKKGLYISNNDLVDLSNDDLCALYYVYFNRYHEEVAINRQLELNYLKIKCEMYKRDLLDTNKDIIKITKIK